MSLDVTRVEAQDASGRDVIITHEAKPGLGIIYWQHALTDAEAAELRDALNRELPPPCGRPPVQRAPGAGGGNVGPDERVRGGAGVSTSSRYTAVWGRRRQRVGGQVVAPVQHACRPGRVGARRGRSTFDAECGAQVAYAGEAWDPNGPRACAACRKATRA